ncbi:sodium:solute symporter [Pseudarthrobacter psychrotolerans]|uniref:Sodium:solute symporter n=1 Tax=Pseudarthrobacter psychrotolerans TaxID=2697569 RepID=A0A6P1NXG0_9MICC|nr:sodium:solute symporter [Pseudarthrobacter psychrotolerans]QHK21701.1 sodium:solute symporter [Pseudarthrobacter psychrotolerans]
MDANFVNIAIVVVYLIAMLAFGWWGKSRTNNNSDFLVAGRRLGPLLYTGTMAAVVLGGASTVGGVGLGYKFGISGMWLVVAIGSGVLLLSLLFAGTIQRLKIYTVSQMLSLRYGQRATQTSGIVMLAYTLMLCATSTGAYATIFVVLFDWERWLAIAVGGAIVLVYSTIGGMWSITLADQVQFIIKTVGIFFLMLPFVLNAAGGFDGIRARVGASWFGKTINTDDTENPEHDVRANRYWVLGLGIVAVLISMAAQDVVVALTIAYDILVGGLLVAILGGLVWKRGTGIAPAWSIAVGSVLTLALLIGYAAGIIPSEDGVYANDPIYWGLGASLVSYIVISLLTPPTDPEVRAAWDKRVAGAVTEELPMEAHPVASHRTH